MNIFFDTGAQPQIDAAKVDIYFRDLDLSPVNDPKGFYESLSFSYWNADTGDYEKIGGVIKTANGLTAGDFSTAASTDPGALVSPSNDPFTWSLDLAVLDIALGALDIMDNLNQGIQEKGGVWIQLGFGAKYCPNNHCRNGTNTAEYLKAKLSVSAVPVPAAFWLFGTALIGFIGVSRRTRV